VLRESPPGNEQRPGGDSEALHDCWAAVTPQDTHPVGRDSATRPPRAIASRHDEQRDRLDGLRHDADLAIWNYLHAATELTEIAADAIVSLDDAVAVMHNDVRIYRQRLLDARPWRRGRHLRALESAADAARRLRLRSGEAR